MSRSEHEVSDAVWQGFLGRISGGVVLDGRVTTVLPFGALIQVDPGVTGLLPRADWSARPEVGATVAVRVRNIDVQRRRMSLIAA